MFLLVDETMQYRPQCRYCLAIHPIMINQNQIVSQFIEARRHWSYCAYERSDRVPSVFVRGPIYMYII